MFGFSLRTNRPPEVLHQRLSLLDFGRVDLTADDRTERDLCSQLLGHSKGQGRLSSTRATGQENSTASHLFRFDQIHHDTAGLSRRSPVRYYRLHHNRWRRKIAYLTSGRLTDEAIARGFGSAISAQTQTLDMRMRGCPVLARIALHFTDLDHGEGIATSLGRPL